MYVKNSFSKCLNTNVKKSGVNFCFPLMKTRQVSIGGEGGGSLELQTVLIGPL